MNHTKANSDPQHCPQCGAEAVVHKLSGKWKVKCSKYSSLGGGCKAEGHTMFTRKDAVHVWNQVK